MVYDFLQNEEELSLTGRMKWWWERLIDEEERAQCRKPGLIK
jgi:hypothetical protein